MVEADWEREQEGVGWEELGQRHQAHPEDNNKYKIYVHWLKLTMFRSLHFKIFKIMYVCITVYNIQSGCHKYNESWKLAYIYFLWRGWGSGWGELKF